MTGAVHRLSAAALCVAALVVASLPEVRATAQPQETRPLAIQQPTRDVSLPQQTGNSALGGTVMTDDAVPQPIRRALLTLSGSGLRSGRMTVSDDQGRF